MQTPIKTICTIGPASENRQVFGQLVKEGMDIARLNFSHATPKQYQKMKAMIDQYNIMYGKYVEIMMDLQGPRMRVGEMPEEGLELIDGEEVVFSTDPKNKGAIHINDPYLHEDIEPNHPLFLASGEFELRVNRTQGQEIYATVVNGGILFSRKGVNVPETNLRTRGLTEKDLEDVDFGIANNVDYIAMSFVKDGQDIDFLREYIASKHTGRGNHIKIVSKIERKQAIANIEEIIHASDLIMVARGDLGVEFPLEEIPILQKEMIAIANKHGKPSIVATQMLMSMVHHPRPTRAEVSDVANAVLDGAWAVMLSDESAFGDYPVESLKYLKSIALRMQNYQLEQSATV